MSETVKLFGNEEIRRMAACDKVHITPEVTAQLARQLADTMREVEVLRRANERNAETTWEQMERLKAENERLRECLSLLIGYALSARSPSAEWLQGLADKINAAADALGDSDRAVVRDDRLIVKRLQASD
jgi:hypothetical protein